MEWNQMKLRALAEGCQIEMTAAECEELTMEVGGLLVLAERLAAEAETAGEAPTLRGAS